MYNRLEIYKSECIDLLIQYFNRFPLKGSRKIDVLRLACVHGYKNMHVASTETAGQKLARLICNLEEPSLEIPLTTFVSDFSDEEKTVFTNLPKNQKNPNYQPPALSLLSFYSFYPLVKGRS